MERVYSNSGAETRQGQKKEVGGETETATQPDAAVELEPKYSTVTGQGGGACGVLCAGNLLFVSLFIIFPLTTLSPIGNIEVLSSP